MPVQAFPALALQKLQLQIPLHGGHSQFYINKLPFVTIQLLLIWKLLQYENTILNGNRLVRDKHTGSFKATLTSSPYLFLKQGPQNWKWKKFAWQKWRSAILTSCPHCLIFHKCLKISSESMILFFPRTCKDLVSFVGRTCVILTWPLTPQHSSPRHMVFWSTVFWRHWWQLLPYKWISSKF